MTNTHTSPVAAGNCPPSPTVAVAGKSPRPTHEEVVKKEKELRENLSEEKVDDMVEDSFPASDPPSTY